MLVSDEMVLAAAKSDYAFDNRGDWDRASRIDRERYGQRSHAALTAALNAMWRPIEEAPKDGRRILAVYGGQTRVFQYGKTSHVPLYGFCLADQGPEDFDLIDENQIKGWQPLPSPSAGEK